MVESAQSPTLDSLQACDASESTLVTATHFLDTMSGDSVQRSTTPMMVRTQSAFSFGKSATPSKAAASAQQMPGSFPDSATASPKSVEPVSETEETLQRKAQQDGSAQQSLGITKSNTIATVSPSKRVLDRPFMSLTATSRLKTTAKQDIKNESFGSIGSSSGQRRTLRRHSNFLMSLPSGPDVSDFVVPCDPAAQYVVVISMYEVHNDRIYDLLTPASKSPATKELRRRPLLFKPTEHSPDRKVVAGLRKVVCTDVREAILVLETGLQERRVASTGSNNFSSRSHGFFCFEVKKRSYGWRNNSWSGSKLTIVDLAGSERARDAKTQGATLAEAGKINESLMYLGQCLQAQSEASGSSKVSCSHPLPLITNCLTIHAAQRHSLQTVQTHRDPLLQLVCFGANNLQPSSQSKPSERRHDCYSGSIGRFQRNFSDPSVQRSRTGGDCSPCSVIQRWYGK